MSLHPRRQAGLSVRLDPEPELFPGDHVRVEASYEGGQMHYYDGTVVGVKPSGTVIVDDSKEKDGLGTPVRHYVSTGTIYLLTTLIPPGPLAVDHDERTGYA